MLMKYLSLMLCREYLFSTMDKLQALGIDEPGLREVSELASNQEVKY